MTQQRKEPADLIGDFQRWLVRSGARGMSRGLGDQLKGTLGGRRRTDVWEHATATPDGEEPECPWCPHCRAKRMLRDSGPGLASQMASAGGTVASVISEAVSVLDAALAGAAPRPHEEPRPQEEPRPHDEERAGGGADRADTPPGGAEAGPAEGLPREPDDRG